MHSDKVTFIVPPHSITLRGVTFLLLRQVGLLAG